MATTNSTGSRRRVTVATAVAAAAVAIAALAVTPATAGAAPQAPAPADPAGAFLFGDGRFTPLGKVPGAAASGHVNVNNRSQVVGLSIDAAEAATTPPGELPPIRSFVKDPGGRVTTFAVPGASATLATGINDRGQIAGTWFDASVTFGDSPYPPGTVHGFVRQPNGKLTTVDLPRFANTAVTDINNRGQLVGQWDDHPETAANEPGSMHGLVWDRGRLTRFDVPGSLSTGALGINNTGQITGAYDDAGGHHGFLLQRGRWSRIDAPGRMATDAWGSNDRGQIVIPELGTGLVPVTR